MLFSCCKLWSSLQQVTVVKGRMQLAAKRMELCQMRTRVSSTRAQNGLDGSQLVYYVLKYTDVSIVLDNLSI
eukprot:6180601-Pleurochrysis_carterae.AAC.1